MQMLLASIVDTMTSSCKVLLWASIVGTMTFSCKCSSWAFTVGTAKALSVYRWYNSCLVQMLWEFTVRTMIVSRKCSGPLSLIQWPSRADAVGVYRWKCSGCLALTQRSSGANVPGSRRTGRRSLTQCLLHPDPMLSGSDKTCDFLSIEPPFFFSYRR